MGTTTPIHDTLAGAPLEVPVRPTPSPRVAPSVAEDAERVVALAERGHELHGLWIRDGLGVSTVGPVPFGHVTDLPAQVDGDWAGAIEALRPDVVWGQLNWRAVDLALAVRRRFPDLPFVWHYKESPQRSLARGDWAQLVELFATADETLVCSEEERGFVLTPRVLDLGVAYVDALGLWEVARPHLERLVERTGESCSIAQLEQ